MRTTRRLSLVVAAIFVLALHSTANAAPQSYGAELDIHPGGLPALNMDGAFDTDVNPPNGTFDVPADSIGGSDGSVGSGPVLQSANVDGANQAGTLSGTGGTMPIGGQLTLMYLGAPYGDFGPVVFPLTVLGDGGATTVNSTLYGDNWQFRLDGAKWQTGTVTAGTQTFMGSDDRTTGGAGTLRLIAPMRVTAIRNKVGLTIPVTGELLIPEPGLLALQVSAAGLMLALGWNRRKRR